MIQYNEENALDALGQIEKYTSNMGMTNIEAAMKNAINLKSSLNKRVILLTDGEITQGGGNDVVIGLAKNEDIVVHTLGISNAADAQLLEATAKAGRGTYSLIED